jgi:DNA-directed RNA polymerase specialized sigma24 family protein
LEAELKAEHKQALSDFFLKGLRYEEISQNRGWPIGNVGAYIKRGLETMRKQRLKYPELVKAAMQYLTMIFA